MLLKFVFDFELVFPNKQNWAILILTLGLVALQSIDGCCQTNDCNHQIEGAIKIYALNN
jgi:hypothetical protein